MKNSWHAIVLIVVGVIVLAVAGLVISKALSFNERFVVKDPNPNNELPETQEALAKIASKFVEKSQVWKDARTGDPPKTVPLFVSVPLIEMDGDVIDMGDPNARLVRPPVSNPWLTGHQLDFLNSGVLHFDPDGDGFTNLEEWNGKTNPKDAESHPPYADKLVFLKREQQEYTLNFSARPDSERFQIVKLPTSKHPRRSNFYMRIGETSEDGFFRIDSFEEKRAKNDSGIEVDASVLTITYLPDGRTFELVRNKPTVLPTYFAELDFILDSDPSFYVKEGEAFNILRDPNTKYRLDKVELESATVEYQVGDQEKVTIEIKKN